MRGWGLTLRGLWERRTLSLIVLVVALVPVATASVGPIFAESAGTEIVRTTLAESTPDERGWRFTAPHSGVPAQAARFAAGGSFLHPPIKGMELLSPEATSLTKYPLMWQDGQCEHVTLLVGRCPAAAGEIMVSRAAGFPLGHRVRVTGVIERPKPDGKSRPAPLQVVGVYHAPNPGDPFWFGRNLFAQSAGFTEGNGDPLFTVPATRESTVVNGATWTDAATVVIDATRITAADLPRLAELDASAQQLANADTETIVFSGLAGPLGELRSQTASLGVPALLVIAQLVGLGWLLLFLTVSDLVTARGPEIALARLRGHGRLRVWRFGLAEPLVLLAVALPAGLALGLALASAMAGALLTVAVPVTVTGQSVLAGAAVLLGGVVAAGLAARNVAVRPVTEEWRRTPRRTARGWIIDAVILAVTGLGLAELLTTGIITENSGQQAGALAVPGLLAVAAALLSCRFLPSLARRLFGPTRRAGGIGVFLALRQIARGPATAGSLIVLGTAFGLATFATAAWSVTSANFERVARIHNGADAVLITRTESVADFRKAVERADPSGVRAAPVLVLPGPPKMLATDPARFAHVANWDRPAASLTGRLGADVAPRVTLTGDRFRLRIHPVEIPKYWEVRMFADLRVPGEATVKSIPLGAPDRAMLEWGLPPACRTAPCELRGLRGDVSYLSGADMDEHPLLAIEATEVATRSGGRWRAIDAGLTDPDRWRGTGSAGADGLTLDMAAFTATKMIPATYPEELPALVNSLTGNDFTPGLDQAYLVRQAPVPVGPAVPGLDVPGGVVDLELADRVAFAIHPKAEFQVWVAPGHLAAVRDGLLAQGLPVYEPRLMSGLVARYSSQGPGLALMLLLMAAIAAAVLALGRAVLALYSAARQRGYELAALEAAGARTPALRSALLLEQLIILCAGMLAGVTSGVVAAWAALPRIPEFVVPPITPPLLYEPSLPLLAAVTGGALLAALVAAAVTAEILLRGVRPDRLRGAPG
ncbi:FtsX-like permease family protein [Streptosporangium sp. KLBMP 9127]|nr:hypothetical protein [Streptosporangium sp. KLBMP 9127]